MTTLKPNENSRKFQDPTQWQLNPKIYRAVCDTFGTPEVDLFASWINRQTKKYVSWKPETKAFAVDAFYVNCHVMHIPAGTRHLEDILGLPCVDKKCSRYLQDIFM